VGPSIPAACGCGWPVEAGRVASVDVASERPRVAEVLRGREADSAVETGTAVVRALRQGAGARRGTGAGRGARHRECEAQVDPAIEHEALREHLWRWLLDLPPLLGAAGDAVRIRRGDALASPAGSVPNWRTSWPGRASRNVAQLRLEVEWTTPADAGTQPAAAFWMPRASLASITATRCRIFAGIRTGRARPPKPVRHRAAGARRRLPACGRAPCAGWRASKNCANGRHGRDKSRRRRHGERGALRTSGRGRALVETARGLLMHEIVLDGERIADYFIVAPTEWNFHPQGPIARLAARPRRKRSRCPGKAFAARAVAALDPCVRWELEWL
jgi:hypothetical protein